MFGEKGLKKLSIMISVVIFLSLLIMFSYVSSGTNTPQYFDNSTNSTIAGKPIEFRLSWTDAVGLSGYIFSFDNATGSFANDTWQQFSDQKDSNDRICNVVGSASSTGINCDGGIGCKEDTTNATIDSCADGGDCDGTIDSEWVWNVTINATVVDQNDTINVSCYFHCYDSDDEWAIAYKQPSGSWVNKAGGNCAGVGTNETYSTSFSVGINTGTAYVRCIIAYDGSTSSTCGSDEDALYSDTDDLNFTIITFCDTECWSNVTKVVNSTIGETIRWMVYANDTSNNWNTSGEYSFVTKEGISPKYSDNSTNSTAAGRHIEFRLNWTDNIGLDSYIFSLDNCTGSFSNVTESTFPTGGTEDWSNVTQTINLTVDCTIQWKIYANDTSDNWNTSDTYSFITTDVDSPQYSDNSTNSTASGEAVEFRLRWIENAGLSGYVFSSDNATGTFVNDTWTPFYNATRPTTYSTINDTYGNVTNATLAWDDGVYDNSTYAILIIDNPDSNFNYTYLYMNFTGVTKNSTLEYTWACSGSSGHLYAYDYSSSAWSRKGVATSSLTTENFTITSDYIQNGLFLAYFWTRGRNGVVAWLNITDVFVNISEPASDWSNVTKVINSTEGKTIRWMIYANDSSDNWNASSIYSFSARNTPEWQNQSSNATTPLVGEAVLLSAQGKDETALNWAWLWTNETGGDGKNYTWTGDMASIFKNLVKQTTNEPLDLPKYNATGYLHTDVIYFPDGKDGYKYWMMYNPHPPESEENPNIVRSNDTVTWTDAGITNPVISPPDSGILHDSDFLYVEQYNTWFVVWAWHDTNNESICLGYSSDGKTWTEYDGVKIGDYNPQIINLNDQTWQNSELDAPTLLFEDGWFHLFYTDLGPGNNRGAVGYANFTWNSTTNDIENFTLYSGNPIIDLAQNDDYKSGCGHIDISKYGGKYFLFNLREELSSAVYDMTLLTSTQLLSGWTDKGTILTPSSPDAWDDLYIYRGSPVTENGNISIISGKVNLYYSGFNQTSPYQNWIGYASENYTPSHHNSPLDLNDTVNTWTWSNFTWNNSSVTAGTTIAWRIYYNDTSGTENMTDPMTFTVKATGGSSCPSDNACLTGYCVHGICRGASTFCGDGYCDTGEDCSSCGDDCACASGYYCSSGECVMYTSKSVSMPSTQGQVWSTLTPGVAKIMEISTPETGLVKIEITVKNPVNNVKISVTKLEEKPTSIVHDVLGKVYKYIEIEARNLQDEDITVVKIEFRVNKSWIEKNNIDPDTITLNRYTNVWKKLLTIKISEDEDFIYYEAETPGFSTFAITGEEVSTTTLPTTTIPTTTTIPVEVKTKLDVIYEYWYIWLTIVIVLVIIIAIFKLRNVRS